MTTNVQHVTGEDPGLPVVATKVQEKIRWWLMGRVHPNDFWFASKAFAFCVRNHPDHPAFDSLESEKGEGGGGGERVTRDEIVQVLKELSKGCRWDYHRGGYGLVVYVRDGDMDCFYDPVPLIIGNNRALITYNKLARHHIKKIAVKVLKEGRKHLINTRLMDMEALCRIEHQLQRCKKKIDNISRKRQ